MHDFWLAKALVLSATILAMGFPACSRAIEGETTSSELPHPDVTIPNETPAVPPDSVRAPVLPVIEPESVAVSDETFYLGQYYNEAWAIAIVEGKRGYRYYGCSVGAEQNCITLTDGDQTCVGDVCTLSWRAGDLIYQAEISEMSKRVFVTQAGTVIVDTGELGAFYQSDDDIPADREAVTGISEAQLKALADQIYRAVYAEDWQAIAALGTDPIRVNYPEQENSTEVARDSLPAVLGQANLDQWQARIMTGRLNDLLLNQYGVMFGDGALWASETVGTSGPQIYSINIW